MTAGDNKAEVYYYIEEYEKESGGDFTVVCMRSDEINIRNFPAVPWSVIEEYIEDKFAESTWEWDTLRVTVHSGFPFVYMETDNS